MKKLITGALALAVCGSFALAGPATAGGGAATKVVLKGEGDMYGYVSSAKKKCANNRLVKLFREKGGSQGGGDDEYLGVSDTTSPNGDKYQFSFGNPGITKGKVYAKAMPKDGCQVATSKTKRISIM